VSIDSLLTTPVGNYLLDELVAHADLAAADVTETDLYAFVTRAAAHASSARWRVPPVRIFPWDAVATVEEATALSRAVLTSAAARWWSSRALDRDQLWIGAQDATPGPGRPSPSLYSKPPNDIWTSSALDDGTSAWWPLLRAGPDSPPPEQTQSRWRLTPRAGVRVCEITSAPDWARLCETFPAPDGAPDWHAVAHEYDGVHLSVEGLIRAQCIAIDTSHGTAMLDGWDVESTAWLRWCFDSVERVGELGPDHVHTTAPVRTGTVSRALASLRARRRS
jgi:hypothetical protein